MVLERVTILIIELAVMVAANVAVSVVKHFGDHSGDYDVKSTFLVVKCINW